MADRIEAVTVPLDEAQLIAMERVIAKCRAASEAGTPGMLLAQVFGDEMKVFFIDTRKGARAPAPHGR